MIKKWYEKTKIVFLVIIFILSIFGMIIYRFMQSEKNTANSEQIKKYPTYRLHIPHNSTILRKDKINALKSGGCKVLAINSFGYDMWECTKSISNLKESLLSSVFSKMPYEIEKKVKVSLDIRVSKLKPVVSLNSPMQSWHDNILEIERAHRFIRKHKIKTKPMGMVVIDSMPNMDHRDLVARAKYYNKRMVAYKVRDRSFYGYDHGTMVACAGGASRNGRGIEGILPKNSYILPIAVNYDSSFSFFVSDVVLGLKYMLDMERAGIISFRVVNMSFGFRYDSKLLFNVFKILKDKLFVVAAGNYGANIDGKNFYPVSWKLDNLIAVGATDKNGKMAKFSNHSYTNVFIAAPGKDITTCGFKNGKYVIVSGTSFSAPFTGHTANLLFSMKPDLTILQIKNLLTNRAFVDDEIVDKVRGGYHLNVYAPVSVLHTYMKHIRTSK